MCDERQSTQEGMGSILSAIKHYYPGAIASINTTLTPTAEAQLAADKAVSPGYAELNQQLFDKYGLPMAKTAAGIEDFTQQAASERELSLAKGTGGELVTQADLLQKKLDPEWYAQKVGLSDAITKYLAANDPKLTENEREEMRRGMGATQANANSAIDTAGRAMQFGKAGQEKAQNYGNVVSNVAAAIPAMRSGISGFDVATRRSTNADAAAKAGQATTGSGTNTYSLANNFLNTAGSLQQQRMSQQQSGLQQATQYVGLGGKLIGSILGGIAGCWVAREVYGEDSAEWLIFRNWHFNRGPRWFHWLYMKYGERFAKFIHNKPRLKSVVKFLMDFVVKGKLYAF